MMYGWMDGYHGMGWGGGLGMLLFWALVILGGIFLVRFVLDKRRAPPLQGGGAAPVETALDILKKRFARGEITREEYARMKGELE